ncbi:hypothetical protein TrRE_jg9405 [Triparma retinervis]|uniref:Uncharacterized protein n=1 Tax=Triparma retinervis TaxID=2557542 RepID=A0A9W7EFN8_9STRA|nr:hypothetical protein TrRE_jg9405 [Triparma retinervis]
MIASSVPTVIHPTSRDSNVAVDSNVDSNVDSHKNLREVEHDDGTNLVEVALLIPYRDREVHLRRFKEYMATYMQVHHPGVNVTIWGIEQHDSKPFNRAWLTNVGLTEVMKTLPTVQCIVQHDVDRYPKLYVDYTDCETPIQLSAENDEFNGGIPYREYAGGVVSLSPKHWKLINGMSNEYHGWGGEDDDLHYRLRENGLLAPSGSIRRPKKGMGQFNVVAETKTAFGWMGSVVVVGCDKLVPPYVTTRFACYEDELLGESPDAKVALVDGTDIWFKDDLFKLIVDGVYVVAEPEHHPMSVDGFHKQWIDGCPSYGNKIWESIKENSMICAGTIFGTHGEMLRFLGTFNQELRRTECNDQGVLNVLIRTWNEKDRDQRKPIVWKFEDNIVLSMNVAKTFFHEEAYVVHTGDNPLAVAAIGEITSTAETAQQFRNIMTTEDDKKAERLLRHIHEACESAGMEYFIDGGTLIGSLLHHGRIPWDDDMDVYFWVEDREAVIEALSTDGFKVQAAYNGLYSKMWDENVPENESTKNGQTYNWPFVDLGWLDSNATHAWELRTAEAKYAGHVYPRSVLSPPASRPYGSLVVNAPHDGDAMLQIRLGANWRQTCVKANWDHKYEKVRDANVGDGNAHQTIECSALPWVPLVREESGVEVLSLQGQVLQRWFKESKILLEGGCS